MLRYLCPLLLLTAPAAADDDDDAAPPKVTTPHGSSAKYIALLAKLDDPKPEANFRSQDDNDRWRYYAQSLQEPWDSFKKEFGIPATAPATIDGDSFQADWYQLLKKESGATLTGPDYRCPMVVNVRAITMDIVWVLKQSKSCTASIKQIKALKCVDEPKQKELTKLELKKDGTLIFHTHDPHEADSSQDFSSVAEEYARIFPACKGVVEKYDR